MEKDKTNKMSFNISETKLKPIIPTLRDKKRFVKIKFETKFDLDFDRFSKGFLSEITYYMGAIDFGKAGIWILKDKFDSESKTFIVRCSNKFIKKFLASCLLINKIDSVNLSLEIIKVSGTIKGVQKEN